MALQLQNIGKYELTKFLGGGMSHVYKARDTLIGRTVAVKILTESGAADQDTKARFIREAQLAGNVLHDNIIRVYDFGEESGRLFMVMEFLEGEDLSDAIKNQHTGGVEERIGIAVQVARAMEHIHSLRIVHRDLKPQNVYITKAGVAKLMDFGIAKTDQTSMTKTGYTVGTPSYMAPEQVLGKNVNHLSDIYSFGILLYELMTGSKPMAGDSVERVFWMILNEPVDITPMRNSGAPEPVVDLVNRCTAKDPATRPQSFTEVRERLEGLRQSGRTVQQSTASHLAGAPQPPKPEALHETVAIKPAAPPPPRTPAPEPAAVASAAVAPAAVAAPKRGWLIPAAVGAVVVLAAIFVFLLTRGKQPGTASTTSGTPPGDSAAGRSAGKLSLPSGDMVLVPGGTFQFGKNNEKRAIPAYYIDEAEVTNEAFGRFVKETGYAAPAGFDSAKPEYPVVNVTLNDAAEFARWAGKRLPNSLEWEKAARGTDGRKYAWGNEETGGPPRGRMLPASDDQASASPYGAVQMTGNVWELVDQSMNPSRAALDFYATLLKPRPTAMEPWCMTRGGAYDETKLIPAYEWSLIPERFKANDIGFRCVRDVK